MKYIPFSDLKVAAAPWLAVWTWYPKVVGWCTECSVRLLGSRSNPGAGHLRAWRGFEAHVQAWSPAKFPRTSPRGQKPGVKGLPRCPLCVTPSETHVLAGELFSEQNLGGWWQNWDIFGAVPQVPSAFPSRVVYGDLPRWWSHSDSWVGFVVCVFVFWVWFWVFFAKR